MDTDEKRALIEQFIDTYNHFDIERMMKLVHHDIVFKNVSGGKVNAGAVGTKEFRDLAEQSKKLFSSRKQSIIKFESTDGGASVGIDYTAVPAADLSNGMKAGETLRLTGRSEFSFRDGKICGITDYS